MNTRSSPVISSGLQDVVARAHELQLTARRRARLRPPTRMPEAERVQEADALEVDHDPRALVDHLDEALAQLPAR